MTAPTQGVRALGAVRHADLLAQATRMIGPIPAEGEARQEAMNAIAPRRFGALEDAWYEDEPLEDIVNRYIRTHPSDFFSA